MDFKYQPPVHSPASPPTSTAQRHRTQKNKRSAQELGVDVMGRRNRPYTGTNDHDASQTRYSSNGHEFHSSNGGYYLPGDSDMSYSMESPIDAKISTETYQNDMMYGAGSMQPNGYSWADQAEPPRNHISGFGDLNTQQDQDMKIPFEEEDASDLFVANDDSAELSEEDQETEEQFTPGTSKKAVHFADEHSNGLGQSCLQGDKKQHQTPASYRQQQALPMLAPSYHSRDVKPVMDPQGNIRSMNNAQQQYAQFQAQQQYQVQQRMNLHSSMNEQFSSRPTVPAAQGAFHDRSRDPRLTRGAGQLPPLAESSPITLAARTSYAGVTQGTHPSYAARPNQEHRARMSATPLARPTPALDFRSTPTRLDRSVPSSAPRPVARKARGPTPSRFANAPYLKPPGAGKHTLQNNLPLHQSPEAVIRPTPVPQPELQPQDLGFSEADIQRFEPNKTDKKVYEWRRDDFGWDNIMSLLHLSGNNCSLSEVKVRQKLMNFKHSLIQKQGGTADFMDNSTVGGSEAEVNYKPLTAEERVPKAPPIPVKSQAHNALSFAAIREKDKLAWEEERRELQQAQQQAEEQLTAERLRSKQLQEELEKERLQSKDKARLAEELTKEKKANEDLRERLKDEQMLRMKAEQDWKDAKKAEHNRALAHASSSRRVGKATKGGIVFSKDEALEEGATPTRSRSRKRPQSDTREDGHSKQGSKTVSHEVYLKWLNHLNKSDGNDDEMEDVDQEIPEQISQDSLTYFVYTLHRKQWPKNEEEPDDEDIVCGQYTYLNAANKAVQEEVFRPFGNNGIVVEPDKDFTLHGDRDKDTGVAWVRLEVPNGFIKVWVTREVHSSYQGQLPQFESNGMLSRAVYVVKQEVEGEVEEQDQIYTTFDLANKKASDKIFELAWWEKSNSRLDYCLRKSAAEKERVEKLEDLEDTKQLYFEETEDRDKRVVKVWVVKRELVGPRNL